jgi:hypothetical protein
MKGIATMRVQVMMVGMVKNMARIVSCLQVTLLTWGMKP